ncbi:CcoQ/FixQ family Cbb3-type cytochrome c oxidase assembly chaperone [Sulfuriferula sp.]|jgi:cbb3-type cytochrome oxidase subunit 3|uniref:cbb3-type cytochrome oxidase subunit 3 n=1 Tax=Sulfuriferula sp. TaxID=2025307 RepID=UPI000ED75E7C|nr:CcoQ/FixQ family Cbb3-type cytochrome c oxidase assembly chaperone [Sulfuriferula sp.]MDP2025256.1 CcoQ/FixQ family Cbb3-type cytochrome c oxidase assembly chaperone [Sulfuriferula sp.]HAN56483.1 CcoQ/FixQ family Cbb3-type cytochrome c oxidase assembly chaperone [Betaproteobacteria bacterium]
MEWLSWFASPENTKPLALVVLFVTFVLIVYFVYGDKKRGERLESYKHMPFMDDEPESKEEKK